MRKSVTIRYSPAGSPGITGKAHNNKTVSVRIVKGSWKWLGLISILHDVFDFYLYSGLV